MSVAEYFRLNKTEAEKILNQTRRAVAEWRDVAKALGIGAGEIARMAVAFDK